MLVDQASDLLDRSPGVRTSAIRRLRFAGLHPDLLADVAANDQAAAVRMEAMASLAVVEPEWAGRLEQAVLCCGDTELMGYGDYLLRELGVWQ